MKYVYCIETPIKKLWIQEENSYIVEISHNKPVSGIIKETKLISDTQKQISEYFNKKRIQFNLPIKINGTEYQEKIWKELQNIPYGTTLTYKNIAEKIGNPKSARAVGNACNKNKLLLIIPCHRVIGQNNKLIGFAGGIEMKNYLLNLEKIEQIHS